MIIENTQTKETFSLRKHKSLPSFADKGLTKKIKFNGAENNFIWHPNKPASPRTSLIIGDTRYYSDDPEFKKYVEGLSGTVNFVEKEPAPKEKKEKKAKEGNGASKSAKGAAPAPQSGEPLLKPSQKKAKKAESTKLSKLGGKQKPLGIDNCKRCGKEAIYATVNGEAICKTCATEQPV